MPEKPGKLIPALYGGIIMGLVSVIPIIKFVNCFCCAGIMLGGFMAVFFYKKDLKDSSPPLTNGDCLALGALAGVAGAIANLVFMAIAHHVFGAALGGGGFQKLQDMGFSNQIPPETMKMMESMMRDNSLLGIAFVFNLVIDPLFGLLGGLIGYSVFKSKAPLVPPPPPPMP